MSLIFDALKKSDRERRVAAGEPFAAAGPTKKRSWLMPAGLIVAVAALGVLALWMWRSGGAELVNRFLNSDTPKVAEQQVDNADGTIITTQENEAPVATAASIPAPADSPAAEPAQAKPELAAAIETPAPRQTSQDTAIATSSPVIEATAQPSARQRAQDRINNRRKQREQRTATAPKEPAPMELYELPMGVRLQVPPLTLNVHVYAQQPEDRFVLLNMQRIEEGDELEGLVARAIRPDGVLLEFQGHQFLLRRP